MEYDQLTAKSYWRWYIDDRKGEWVKTRKRAKLLLSREMIEPKETKKDPDKLRIGSFVWGPDKYFDTSNSNPSPPTQGR